MSYSFLMIYYKDTYKNAIKLNGPSNRICNVVKEVKKINNKEGCIKRKFLLKSVLLNYLNK